MLRATRAETGNALVALVAANTPIQLVLALRGFDCTTRVIESAHAALADLSAQPPDVVVIEHDPGLDAFALTRSLRAVPALVHTPLLIIATGEGRAERRAALQAGATDLMLKPVDTLDFQIRLRTFIELAAARRDSDRHRQGMNQQVEPAVAEVSAREREIVRRIVAVADVFDALISARAYKPTWPLEQARAHLGGQAGIHFDSACVAAFVSRWEDIVSLVQHRPATSQAA